MRIPKIEKDRLDRSVCGGGDVIGGSNTILEKSLDGWVLGAPENKGGVRS